MNSPSSPHPFAELDLLPLHAATDSVSLWAALVALLGGAFENHFLVAALRFMAAQPTVTLRTRPAPRRSAAWWRRNIAVHPGIEWLMQHPGAQLARVSDIMPLEPLRRHPYYHAFMQPEGWIHGMGFFFWEGRELAAIVGINRTEAQGDFSDAEVETCRRLYPHLQVALRRIATIEAKLNAQQALSRVILQLPQPTLLLDWEGQPLYLNEAARSSLARWQGRSSAAARAGTPRLPPEIVAAAREVRTQMEKRAGANEPLPAVGAPTIASRQHAGLTATIEAVHLNAAPLSPPTFLVRLNDGPSPAVALTRLSPREQELALMLCDGRSNKELAAALGKSEHTVKNQLKTVFRKLGIRSRAHLVGLLRQQ